MKRSLIDVLKIDLESDINKYLKNSKVFLTLKKVAASFYEIKIIVYLRGTNARCKIIVDTIFAKICKYQPLSGINIIRREIHTRILSNGGNCLRKLYVRLIACKI